MKRFHGERLQRLILCMEAVLIILSLATGSSAKVGMACYWAIIAVYHLTEFLSYRRNDSGKDDDRIEWDAH